MTGFFACCVDTSTGPRLNSTDSPDQHRQRKTQNGVELFQPEQNTGVESERVKGSRAEEDSKAPKTMVVWGLSEEQRDPGCFMRSSTRRLWSNVPLPQSGPVVLIIIQTLSLQEPHMEGLTVSGVRVVAADGVLSPLLFHLQRK